MFTLQLTIHTYLLIIWMEPHAGHIADDNFNRVFSMKFLETWKNTDVLLVNGDTG